MSAGFKLVGASVRAPVIILLDMEVGVVLLLELLPKLLPPPVVPAICS
jgi:hypothetical protein